MDNSNPRAELSQKVLVHLYNSAVIGALRSTAPVLAMKDTTKAKNPRLGDLQRLFELVGEERRVFYAAAAAIAEFAVYCTVDFIENYNRFDSEENDQDFPHLSLSYVELSAQGVNSLSLSEYGSQELGQLFKVVAKSTEMRSLVESVIDQLTREKQPS